MKRIIAGIAVGFALVAGTLFFAPAAHSAPARAGIGTIRAASPHTSHAVLHAVMHVVTHAQLVHHIAAHHGYGRAVARPTHSLLRYTRTVSGRTYGAHLARGRYGTSAYARFNTAYSRAGTAYSRTGYTSSSRYAAAGTTHHCPNMTTSSGK